MTVILGVMNYFRMVAIEWVCPKLDDLAQKAKTVIGQDKNHRRGRKRLRK